MVWHINAYKSVKDIHIVTKFGAHVANTVKTQQDSYRPHGGAWAQARAQSDEILAT
jgi:hypothetical protein